MPLGLGPRFVVEAAFLIAVAVAAGMLSLATPAIVGVMGGAWLLVAAVEWALSRRASRAPVSEAAPPEPPREPARRPEPRPEPAVEPEPLSEPVPPGPIAAARPVDALEALPEGAAPPLEEPVPPEPIEAPKAEPVAERPALEAVPDPEPEPEPTPEPEREPEPEPVGAEVVELQTGGDSAEWNVWDLERATRAVAGEDVARDEERAFLLLYLRDFAGPDGSLPARFDALVRESFGDVLGSGAR